MPNVLKVLGQSNPSATTLTTLYTVPAATSTVVSACTICNQGAAGSFRIAIRAAGAAIDPKQYIYYDSAIGANVTIDFEIGMTLATTDVVSVYASHANMSFNLFGQEIS